jgi:hypothetical protein
VKANNGRDPRLDFFRGAAMFIIFIAHCRGNWLWNVIPARFGPSDAADMFVFVSGYAAAIAFGGAFLRSGWLVGAGRIALRCWQLYLGHILLFFVVAALAVAGTRWYGDTDYVEVLEIGRFFSDTPEMLMRLFGLSYVPHYFDILPVYIVVLAMVPIAMPLSRLSPFAVPAASAVLYVAAWVFSLNFLADAGDGRPWYFDPFAWQLIFFTGFSLSRGWIKVPMSRGLAGAAIAIVVAGIGMSVPAIFETIPPFDALRIWVADHSDKTYLDLIQYVHFLATAYLAVYWLQGREAVLLAPGLRVLVKCGQQALSIFLSGIVLSDIGGMVFDHIGTGLRAQLAVNIICFALLIAIAYTVAWFKAAPWKQGARAQPSRPRRVEAQAGARDLVAVPVSEG